MRDPSDNDLLEVWERGRAERPGARAVRLLHAAWPERDVDELSRLPLGRRNGLLLRLRAACLGETITALGRCTACGEAIEVRFTPDALGIGPADPSPAPVPHRLTHGRYDVEFRLPASVDVQALDATADVRVLARTLLARCILAARRAGGVIAPAELPQAVLDAVAAEIERLDPHADIGLHLTCAACAHAWQQPLDVIEFVWAELAARGRRLLTDVARLATAFGWSEREILALPASRRRSYLELLDT
jgi:hypothetical protein